MRRITAIAAISALGLSGLAAPALAAPGDPGLADLALSGTASASRFQNNQDGAFPASLAIDGDPTTRWASGTESDVDPDGTGGDVTFEVDLGSVSTLDSVKLVWEDSSASSYTLDVSEDGDDWTTVQTVVDGTQAETRVLDLDGAEGQFVRLTMTEQIPNNWEVDCCGGAPRYYGYSLFAFEVWGEAGATSVAFASEASDADAGTTATIPVRLNQPADTDTTVQVTSADGTATAGDDYTAVDDEVTILAGETEAVVTSEIPAGAAGGTFTLTLADPSAGVDLGVRTAHTVTVHARPVALPSPERWVDFHDMEGSEPPAFNWGDGANNHPVLTLVPSDREGDSPESTQAMQAQMPVGNSWGGFSEDPNPYLNWRDYDAFRFWVKGNDNGAELKLELKSSGLTFKHVWFDDSDEWKAVEVLFEDLRVEGSPSARFDPRDVRGWGMDMYQYGPDAILFDDFELRQLAGIVETFDDDPTVTTEEDPVGIYAWADEPDNLPEFDIVENDRDGAADASNKVLAGTYEITSGGWGGVTQNFEETQDWRLYKGIRFWWYASQETNPASPTAGADIKFEIRTGGPNGANAALYQTSFKDNWGSSTSRWKLVEIPFKDLERRTDYQPGGAPSNPTPILGQAWGWSLTFVPDTAETAWVVDQLETYGAAASPDDIIVSVDPTYVLVDNGETAEITVTAESDDGEPLVTDVSVAVQTHDGTAIEGTDYTAVSDVVEFERNDESGSTRTVSIPTTDVAEASVAKNFTVSLEPSIGDFAGDGTIVINAHGLPYLDANLSDEERAADLLGRMSIDEKVGQTAQGERLALQPGQIASLGLGSILSGGGSVPANNTAAGWADMVDGYQREALSTPLQIPMIYGVDAVHGHSNVIGATILPHNIGLGATRDPETVKAGLQVTARDVRATGIPWTFAPTLAVVRDDRWGRGYESFGEDPSVVKLYAAAAVEGLQGDDPSDLSGADTVLATAKHWAGDGGTSYGTGTGGYTLDQAVTKADSMAEFLALHGSVYEPALEAGLGSIMPSYSAVQIGEDTPIRMHEHEYLNTTVLKEEMGFEGFLISDWEGVDKVAGLPVALGGLGGAAGAYKQAAINSINSGMDMVMAPYNYATYINAIKDGLDDGDVELSRIDDAVTRILKQKFALGLFEQPFSERDNVDSVGDAASREVARSAAAKSQVLLKNEDSALPLDPSASIYVAGSTANDLGRQMGGWTISWQGGSGQTTDGTTIGAAIDAVGDDVTIGSGTAAPAGNYDVGVVVVGEKPYAEGVGDVGNPQSPDMSMTLSNADRTTITNVATKVDKLVVLIVSGRPQVVDNTMLDDIDALVASWLPGSEGDGVADVLFGAESYSGSLSVTWPADAAQVPINVGDADYEPAFPFGWGLRTDSAKERLESLVGTLPAGAEQMLAQVISDDTLWNEDGSLADEEDGLKAVQKLVALLNGTDNVFAASTAASIARDVASADYTVADAAAFAAAELDVVSGNPADAVIAMAAIGGITLDPADSQPSSNADAASIQINGSPLAGFSADITEYTVAVPAGSPVPVVEADAVELGAVVTVEDATDLPGETTVTITAPDGETVKTYTIEFTVTLSSNADAAAIRVNGAPLAGFDASTTQYSVEIPEGSSVPVVEADAVESGAVVAVTAATSLPGSTTVTITAPDGETVKTYTIAFTVKPAVTPIQEFTNPGTASFKGKKRFGRTLTASITGTQPGATAVTYQWLRAGKPIAGATSKTYKVKKKDVGKRVNVAVTVHRTGFKSATVTAKAVKVKKAKTKTRQKVKVNGKRIIVRVTVKTAATKKPKGKVVVRVGKTKHQVKLKAKANGKVKVTVRMPKSGRYKVRSNFKPSKVLAKSKTKKVARATIR